MSRTKATLDYLRHCQKARAAGYQVSYINDPAWLVTMAINRRAGWPDDPGFLRGSAMPVRGRYPKRASDQNWRDLVHFAHHVNSRCILRAGECRHIPQKIKQRLASRIEQ